MIGRVGGPAGRSTYAASRAMDYRCRRRRCRSPEWVVFAVILIFLTTQAGPARIKHKAIRTDRPIWLPGINRHGHPAQALPGRSFR
jgi:hypothetical protein